MIKIKGLSFKYPTTQVFKDFSLEIDDQIFGLVGENGAGKSTLLKLLIGLFNPQKGYLAINGIDVIAQTDEVLKTIGVLHENAQFPSWYRVFDHLVWLGQLRGLSKDDAIGQANFLLAKFGLKDKRKQLVSSLSAGLRQRFGLSQALIGLPEIIFLDEPTAHLDVRSRIEVFKFLKELARKENIQIVIMSHILNDLEKFCDGFAIISKGQLLYQDKIEGLLKKRVHLEYSIRTQNRNDMEDALEKIQGIGGLVLEASPVEAIVKFQNQSQVNEFNGLKLSNSISVNYTRSLMEELFLEMTNKPEEIQ